MKRITKADQKFIKKFGLHIRAIRNKKDWTLEYTEEMGWKSWKHLQQIESGVYNVQLTTIARIAKLYKMNLSELFKGFN